MHACFCIGPQPGQPLCPCRMKNVTIKRGHWVEEVNHGPAWLPEEEATLDLEPFKKWIVS